MKGFSLTLPIFILISLVSCAQIQKAKPTKSEGRIVASSSADVAKSYYDLAVTLSKARANGHVCDSGVYQENVIEALQNAREFDFGTDQIYKLLQADSPETKALKAQVGQTFSYKLLSDKSMKFDAYVKSSKVRDLLIGTTFESQGVGAFGHTLEYHFNSGNKITKKQLTNIDTFPMTWSETIGTWQMNGYSSKKGGHLVSMKTEYLTGPNTGKNKTEVFVIKRTCDYGACFYGLIPANKVNDRVHYTPKFYDFRVFDLKTDECDA